MRTQWRRMLTAFFLAPSCEWHEKAVPEAKGNKSLEPGWGQLSICGRCVHDACYEVSLVFHSQEVAIPALRREQSQLFANIIQHNIKAFLG